MQEDTPKMTATESALIRSALPNFVNFMPFLHPGQACAARFHGSTAGLGWDGSLLHCKSQGSVVPSFNGRQAFSDHFPLHSAGLRPVFRIRIEGSNFLRLLALLTPHPHQKSTRSDWIPHLTLCPFT